MCPLVPFLVCYCFPASCLFDFHLICVVVAGFFLAVVNGLLSLCNFHFLWGGEVNRIYVQYDARDSL